MEVLPGDAMKRPQDTTTLQGFSLLEVSITIAILLSATLAAILLLVPVARQARLRREVETANSAAKRILERIQATPYKDIVTLYPQSYSEVITGLNAGSITITYVDPAADPLLIQADLTWNDPESGTLQRTFNTVRTE